jgi:hypothetical protein
MLIETKVAAGGAVGAIVTAILQLVQTYAPGFHIPPATTTALVVTILTVAGAFMAPHTTLPGEASVAAGSVAQALIPAIESAEDSAPAGVTMLPAAKAAN